MITIDSYLYSAPSTTNATEVGQGSVSYRYSAPSTTQTLQIGEILPQVEAPIILPAGGIINNNIYATITCPTAGATIYMTLNGETPTTSSPVYEGAFLVDKTLTVKAMAVKAGMANSSVVSVTYTMVVNTVAAPVISPMGGNFNAPVTISLSSDTIGATIYYTTNGSTPTPFSTSYTAPFTISSTTLVKALAVKTGMLNSTITSATFNVVLETKVATPQLTPGAGVFADPMTVTLGTATLNAALYYTVDGSTPGATSTLYTGVPISITNNTTLKVVGIKAGLDNSDIVTADYVIQSTSKPTDFVAVNNDTDPYGTSARLSWVMEPISGLSGFKIVYGLNSGAYTEEIDITNTLVTSYIVEGLTTNTSYYFAIKAIYGSLESNLSEESSCFVEDVIKPPAPTNFVASITADGKGVWLRWVNPTHDFSHVVLVKNPDHIPASPTDGEQIYIGTAEEHTDWDI